MESDKTRATTDVCRGGPQYPGCACPIAAQQNARSRCIRPVPGTRAGGAELRHVTPHRVIEVHKPFVDELHDQAGGKDLGYRLDLKHCVGRNWHARTGVDHAVHRFDNLVADGNEHRRPRNVMHLAGPCHVGLHLKAQLAPFTFVLPLSHLGFNHSTVAVSAGQLAC